VDSVQGWLRAGLAALAGLWHVLPELTSLLVVLMGIDILLGFLVAVKERKLNTSTATWGVTKKVVTLLVVYVAAVINPHVPFMGIDLVQAASFFYLVPELTSIIRNAAVMDVPMFAQLAPVLAYFQAAAAKGMESTKKP